MCQRARRRQTNERVKVGDCRSQGRLRSRSFKAREKRQSACPRDRRLGLIQDQPVELLLRISRSNASGVKRGTVMRRSLPPVRRPSSNRLRALAADAAFLHAAERAGVGASPRLTPPAGKCHPRRYEERTSNNADPT
jgi:hypothetical protein